MAMSVEELTAYVNMKARSKYLQSWERADLFIIAKVVNRNGLVRPLDEYLVKQIGRPRKFTGGYSWLKPATKLKPKVQGKLF